MQTVSYVGHRLLQKANNTNNRSLLQKIGHFGTIDYEIKEHEFETAYNGITSVPNFIKIRSDIL